MEGNRPQRSGLPGKDVCPRLRRLQAGRAHTARPQHRGSEGTRLDFPDVRQRQSCHLGDAASPGHSSLCRGEVSLWQHGRATPATHAQRRWHSAARYGGSQPSATVPSVPAPHTPTMGLLGGSQVPRALKSCLQHKLSLYCQPRWPRAVLPCRGQPVCPRCLQCRAPAPCHEGRSRESSWASRGDFKVSF